MKGFIERALLVVETMVLGYQVVELPHLLAAIAGIVVAVMATVVLVAKHTHMMNSVQFEEEHHHDAASDSQNVHTLNCATCAKKNRARYF